MLKLLCLIDTDDRNYYFRRALKRLAEEYPGEISGECYSPMEARMNKGVQAAIMKAADACDFAVVYFHGGCANLPDFHKFWERVTGRAPCFIVSSLPEEMEELLPTAGVSPEEYRALNDYFSRASEENCYNMLRAIAYNRFHVGDAPAPYEEVPYSGLFVGGKVLGTAEEQAYMEEAKATDKPVIAVLVQRGYVESGNTKGLEALINELEKQGAFVLPVFSALSPDVENGEHGVRYALEPYFCPEGKRIIDCIVATTMFSLTRFAYRGDGGDEFRTSIFEKWDVPVLKAMTTRLTAEQFAEKTQGVDSMSLVSNVYQPEMDGQIITVPYALSETSEYEGLDRRMWTPIPDRIEHLAKLALNYAALSRKKNSEKKVAILFHNQPGNHNIGRGAGLDTFASVHKALSRMKEEGYTLETVYENGQELADTLVGALTNDTRWISSEEAVQRSADLVPLARMKEWFDGLPRKTTDNLLDYWGEFPGAVMVEDGKLLIPGIVNGNVFIGLQPSRAFDQQAERLYHDPVFPPPYSYIAYYRWLEETFQADAILHVGTHGSVEWLPGKEVGLSCACYPNICVDHMPHFYIYHMGIVGEGIQAKRRTAAGILEHLPPSMDDAGVYDKLADVEGALKEYQAAKQARIGQTAVLQKRILDLAEAADLLKDLRMSREAFEAAPEACIDKIHVWMEELKNSAVTDGLHIFGEPPEKGKLYENMLRMLLRIKNGDVPALNDAVLIAMGYDADHIKDHPTETVNGRTASVIFDEAVETAKTLVHSLAEVDYDEACIDALLADSGLPADRMPLKEALAFLCNTACPRVDATVDEMENLLHGLAGGFIEPGLGGNPTRGNVALLPSGRNFYAGDPAEIPSRGAWEIGQKLADRAIEHYMGERGEYPESIAMVIWAGNVIKSSGEDFGEIFSLMGVRPVYLGNSSKVLGVEAIPIEELGRPRIDVTLRISGLFRDMYPNLIELMDAAVACAAAQDESEEQNYIKKHINEDMCKLLDEGLDANEALDQAYLRVFGCAAGGYGAGVNRVIGNKNWTDFHDLAKVYETWSGNAYGRGFHGEGMQKMFKRRLVSVGMTIKNETTIETDMLSSDDYFSYHGGLVACVRSNSGKAPIALTGHTDDPERPLVRDAAKETARIMRSRVLNPKWLEGLKRHGFKGAQEISKAIDSFFGWDASAEVAEDWMYENIARDFLFDKETREWIEEVNAGVIYDVAGKLLEANKRGMWNAKAETLSQLQSIFLNTEGLLEEGKR
ncbi:MAG: cobaltochelatase subunit CobN [bacterium]|nr:cobaltochelatase subunit CobN [bacterium]